MSGVLGRFAPSPSGRMHLGNIFSCLMAWLSARSQDGRILLRIEDLDPQRTSRAYADQLMRDLEYLGLTWDQGPYWQSERDEYYEDCLLRLSAQGLVYPCFCTRAQLHPGPASAPHASDGEYIYSGRCRGLSAEQIAGLKAAPPPPPRLRAEGVESFTDRHYGPQTCHLQRDCGDFILRRSDGVFAYQLAVTADDGLMGVTEVVRGRDLLSSCGRQLYLYRLLGLTPPKFAHIPMLLSKDGRRLSKRDKDMDLSMLKTRFNSAELLGRLAYLGGQPTRAQDLVKVFSWDKLPKEDLFLPDGLFG